ncbi:MAG: general secretion pathway protein GspK [Deltaproteobacteria bacterium]|nr:general secretion pathway protein GspK [Deltaproteobacteria bacterium]
MGRRPINNHRGVALIVVILMISVIIAVTLELNRSSRASVYEAANLADHVKLQYVAKSGFNLGVALLLDDMNNFDGLSEDWAVPEVVAAKGGTLFEDEALQINIVDESGKIPVNKLVNGNAYYAPVRDLLVYLLSQPEFGLDRQAIDRIVGTLKDFIDGDSEISEYGAESFTIEGLNKTYTAKNKPLDCIDEILMISGVARELYYGTKEMPGVGQYLTVYGDGKININTAPLPVLKALFRNAPTDDALARMDADRKTPGAHNFSDPSWYKNVLGAGTVPVDEGLISTRSDYFEITAAGRHNNLLGRVTGVIRRTTDRKSVNVLSWRSE